MKISEPIFFKTTTEFRKWMEKNHDKTQELRVVFYKVDSGKPSITWPQSVDVALCFGWIDSVRNSIDKDSYQIRFTPRKAGSNWSGINIRKVEVLLKQGLMTNAGMSSFMARKEDKSEVYSYEKDVVHFSSEFEKLFMKNVKAWEYFQMLSPSYKNPASNWVMSAKQESTRLKRLQELILDSENGVNKWKDNPYNKNKAKK